MTWFLQVGAALGGLTFVSGVITAFALWRKSKAEAKKTGADAASVLTDTALKAATSAIKNMEERAQKLGEQLEKTQDELQAVRRHMGRLEMLLRERGVPVPDFVFPPRNGVT